MPAEWCDGFLQLVKGGQPIKGESIDKEFTDAIEFQSFQFGSMSGFTDNAALYAAQDAGQRRSLAESRFGAENNFGEFASLFGDDEQTIEMDEKDYKEFEGKDLADVDACNFQIVKQLDLSSPNLFRAYCSTQDLEHREVFESATVSLKKATGGARAVFLKYTFNDVVIVGYTLEVGKDGLPKETISLSFGKVHAEYKPQTKAGELDPSVQGGWDFIDRGPW